METPPVGPGFLDTLLVGLACSFALWSTTEARAQNLLDDPGFELATSDGQTSNSDWVLDVSFPNIASGSAEFRTATWASYPAGTSGSGVWLRPFEGEQVQGGPAADAIIRQDVSAPGGFVYELSAWHKQEANYTSASTRLGIVFSSAPTFERETFLGSNSLELNGLNPRDATWIEYSVTGTAPRGTAWVRVFAEMVDGVDAIANPQSGMFDEFSLSVVHEPAGS